MPEAKDGKGGKGGKGGAKEEREKMKKHLFSEIERVAYDLYEKRGRSSGYELEDWLKAEKIVMERHAKEIEKEARAMKTEKAQKKKPAAAKKK